VLKALKVIKEILVPLWVRQVRKVHRVVHKGLKVDKEPKGLKEPKEHYLAHRVHKDLCKVLKVAKGPKVLKGLQGMLV
jgi:hypothetical protein